MENKTTIITVDKKFGNLKWMNFEKARMLRELFKNYNIKDCLELGFFQGKSSAFIAAILNELNPTGHLVTIDKEVARQKKPNIGEVLNALNLSKYVTVYYEPKSYTWRLMKMLQQKPIQKFDFCYIDGGHNWDDTGFAFFVVDKLMQPGGWIVFDDLNYSLAKNASIVNLSHPWQRKLDQEEKTTKQIKNVWELLVKQHPGYNKFKEINGWCFAQKAQ